CAACHTATRPRLDWRQPRRACVDCHADPHGGQFAAELARGGCAACHSSADWRQPRIDHSGFPLTGAHARVACARCHGAAAGSPASYRGVPRTCEGCHQDAHAGQFRLSAPERACTDCHGTERFAIAAFDHAGTGWPLAGRHRQVACAGCHPGQELRNGVRAVRYRLGYRTCRDCHPDPHQTTRALPCSQCHAEDGWRLARAARGGGFDHDVTGFPLRGGHRAAACASCHAGRGTPRSDCAGCHRDGHRGRLGSACAECHNARSWSDTGALARHRRTRLPLTGRHALVDCAACHRRGGDGAYPATPSDCFACHAADYRGDIHPDHDGEPGGPAPIDRDCGRCHRPTGWSPAVADPAVFRSAARARAIDHDARFLLSFGPHRRAGCADCHVTARPTAAVRCDGCHTRARVIDQHRRVGTAAVVGSCLRCHPGGLR
ncbi:MAG TPA: hypothetical protein VL172_21640, partial [Kofleriaceae bacterium]|nr:hypothetical protein [Kofleriaceae bacterium]